MFQMLAVFGEFEREMISLASMPGQTAGAFAEYEKVHLVSKLRHARERVRHEKRGSVKGASRTWNRTLMSSRWQRDCAGRVQMLIPIARGVGHCCGPPWRENINFRPKSDPSWSGESERLSKNVLRQPVVDSDPVLAPSDHFILCESRVWTEKDFAGA